MLGAPGRQRGDRLQQLEDESVHIIREVAAQFRKPVMLYSIGKDSSVMLHLARKAFHPAPIPFPLLHVDTTWKFREMIAFRDRMARHIGFDLVVHTNAEGVEAQINPFDHGSLHYTDVMKTQALKQALDAGRYDAAFGGARRDEEPSRAKERIFSFRDRHHRWDPKNQRPELWNHYNGRVGPGESIRVFPLSNWTELDVWHYIAAEGIEVVPVQLVIRPDHRFRGFAGTVCEGTLRAGDRVQVEPSGRTTTIERIVTFDGDLDEAETGRAVVVATADEIDIGRGDVIVDLAQAPQRGRQLTATIVWMSEADLVVGGEYLLQQGGQTMSCRVSEVMSRLDFDTLESVPAAAVGLNDIARATVRTETELIFDPYAQNRTTGSFILIDEADNATVAAGMIAAAAPGAGWEAEPGPTLERQRSSVSSSERTERLGQRPVTVLLTGLTGAGKSTIASALERELFDRGRTTVRLDGENMRLGVSKDLGFSPRTGPRTSAGPARRPRCCATPARWCWRRSSRPTAATATGCGASIPTARSWRCSWTRPCRSASSETPRASMPGPGPGP